MAQQVTGALHCHHRTSPAVADRTTNCGVAGAAACDKDGAVLPGGEQDAAAGTRPVLQELKVGQMQRYPGPYQQPRLPCLNMLSLLPDVVIWNFKHSLGWPGLPPI